MKCKEIIFYLNIPELGMLNCAAVITLTCTVSTYEQYNPINKHPYPSSPGCENKQKSQGFVCSPSSCDYYHQCIEYTHNIICIKT